MKFLIPRLHPVDQYLAWAVGNAGHQLDIIGSFSNGEEWLDTHAINDATYFHIDSHQASGLSAVDYVDMYFEFLLNHVRQHHIDCILPSAATDMILTAISLINEEFGLPGINTAQATLFGRKMPYMYHLSEQGVSVPRMLAVVMPGDELNLERFDFQYPVICKPDRGTGSKGIYVAENEDQLRWFFGPSDRPDDFSEKARRVHDRLSDGSLRNYVYHGEGGAYFVEPFIDGPCISIGGTVDASGLSVDCIHEVDVTPLPYRSETGYSFQVNPPAELKAAVDELVGKLEATLPFPNGAWRTDCIWSDGRLHVVDVAPRMCTTASQALAWSANHFTDYAAGVIESIIHGERQTELNPHENVHCRVLDLPKGVVKKVMEPEDLYCDEEEMPWEGTRIYEPRNDLQSWGRGYVLTCGSTIEQARRDVDAYLEELIIEME